GSVPSPSPTRGEGKSALTALAAVRLRSRASAGERALPHPVTSPSSTGARCPAGSPHLSFARPASRRHLAVLDGGRAQTITRAPVAHRDRSGRVQTYRRRLSRPCRTDRRRTRAHAAVPH